MKKGIFPVILLVFILGISSFTAISGTPIPLPSDLNIVQSNPKIPGSYFSGIWEGTLITSTGPKTRQVTSDLCIAIEKINEDLSVTLIYATRTDGKESFERTIGKLSERADEIDFDLKSGAKVNLFYNPSLKKIYVKYVRGRVYGDAALNPRSQ